MTSKELMKSAEKPMLVGRPTLSIYHPTAKGTGSAIKMMLHPATENVDGYIEMRIARQLTVGDARSNPPTYPTFDWDDYAEVRLGFEELCSILQVMRGECESINDGRGIFVEDGGLRTVIRFRHMIEPVCGYALEVCSHDVSSGGESNYRFFFYTSEATGLCSAIDGVLAIIAFGVPRCLPV